MIESSETSQDKAPTLYTLVDISTLEGVKFLKRAPMRNILIFGKLYAIEGKPTKRLDLISDKEQLQYLFYNTTNDAPSEKLEILINECERLAKQVPVDETTLEELKARLPVEVVESAQTDEEDDMGQGGTKKSLVKGGKGAAKKAAVKKAEKPKAAPKKSQYAGKILTATVDENPRKAGTAGHKSFAIVLKNPGITYEDYVKNGGRSNDLQWDVERKRIKVTKVLAAEGPASELADEQVAANEPAALSPAAEAVAESLTSSDAEVASSGAPVAEGHRLLQPTNEVVTMDPASAEAPAS